MTNASDINKNAIIKKAKLPCSEHWRPRINLAHEYSLRNAIHDTCFQFRYILCNSLTSFDFPSFLRVQNSTCIFYYFSWEAIQNRKLLFCFNMKSHHGDRIRWMLTFCNYSQHQKQTAAHTMKLVQFLRNFSLAKEIWKWKWTKKYMENHNPDEHQDYFGIHMANVICVLKSAKSIFKQCHKSN